MFFETDVNAPAFSESKISGSSNLAYITVGTGIGVGLVVNEKTVHGLIHPEGGHIKCPVHPDDIKDGFKGVCRFHQSCIEGMCCSASVAKRKGIEEGEVKNIEENDQIWDRIAYYLSHLCCSIILLNSVEKIVMGGGMMQNSLLLPKIRVNVVKNLNKYLNHEKILQNIDQLIVKSEFEENSGIIGCVFLAREIYQQEKT